MFAELARLIALEVGFAEYFWDANAPGNGFSLSEDDARHFYGQFVVEA